MTSFAGVAAAQEPPPEQNPPPEQYAPPPQQGYAPPPQYAPPPGYYNPPPPAGAAPIALGAAGQLVISDDLLVAATRTSQSFMGQRQSYSSITLQPAIDVFVAPNFSIGGQVRISVFSSDGNNSTTIGVLPRIGYNIPIGPVASIWPRISLAYLHTSSDVTGGGASTSSYTFSFIAFVPILFQPAPHFFIGGGPYLSTDLISKVESTDSYKSTDIGVLSTVGGYFGGS